MSEQHTAGETWRARQFPANGDDPYFIIEGGRGYIHHGTGFDISGYIMEPDVRLILAAPAFALAWGMLSAELRADILRELKDDDKRAWAELAIEKATGENI